MVAIDGLAREEGLLHSLVILKYTVDIHSAFSRTQWMFSLSLILKGHINCKES